MNVSSLSSSSALEPAELPRRFSLIAPLALFAESLDLADLLAPHSEVNVIGERASLSAPNYFEEVLHAQKPALLIFVV